MAITINNPTAAAVTASSRTFVSISGNGPNSNQSGTGNAYVVYTVPTGKIFNGYAMGQFTINGGGTGNIGTIVVPIPLSVPGGTSFANVRGAGGPGWWLWGYEE